MSDVCGVNAVCKWKRCCKVRGWAVLWRGMPGVLLAGTGAGQMLAVGSQRYVRRCVNGCPAASGNGLVMESLHL